MSMKQSQMYVKKKRMKNYCSITSFLFSNVRQLAAITKQK